MVVVQRTPGRRGHECNAALDGVVVDGCFTLILMFLQRVELGNPRSDGCLQ